VGFPAQMSALVSDSCEQEMRRPETLQKLGAQDSSSAGVRNPSLALGSHVQEALDTGRVSDEPLAALGHPAHPRADRGQPKADCSTATTWCRILLSAIYHSEGENKFKPPGNLCL
jgi:hypothetical protein